MVSVDKVEIDKVGKLTILYTFNYCYISGKFLAHQSNLLSERLYGDEVDQMGIDKVGIDEVGINRGKDLGMRL